MTFRVRVTQMHDVYSMHIKLLRVRDIMLTIRVWDTDDHDE